MQFYSAVECAKKHTLEYLPNKRTVSNNRAGWDICQKSIREQDLISAQSIRKLTSGLLFAGLHYLHGATENQRSTGL